DRDCRRVRSRSSHVGAYPLTSDEDSFLRAVPAQAPERWQALQPPCVLPRARLLLDAARTSRQSVVQRETAGCVQSSVPERSSLCDYRAAFAFRVTTLIEAHVLCSV